MYQVSDKFREYCKRHIRTFKSATITYYEGNEQQTIESDQILKFEISANPYIDYQIIGQAVAKKIHINLKGSHNLANKEINVTTTMIYDDNTEEVLNLGNYIIASDYDSSVKNQCSFTGYDYMIKLDTPYSDEGLEYPCTLQDVLNDMCEKLDIELYSISITNGGLQVTGNNFDNGATYRDVLKQIAQVSGTFAYIDRSNKLHVDNLNKVGLTGGTILQFKVQGTLQKDGETIDNSKETLSASYYLDDFKQSREYGPVNKVQLTQTDIEDATYKEDAESISQNGIQTITINDNYFLGTIDAREYAINNLWSALYGLQYTPINCTYLGFPYLEMGDLIEIVLPNNQTTHSYIFNYTFTYNGGYMGKIDTPTISRVQEEYPTESTDEKIKKIGVSVDRAEGSITALVQADEDIKAELELKVSTDDNDQIISMINASADVITLNSNRLIINSSNFVLDAEGNITATGGDIGGFNLSNNNFSNEINGIYKYNDFDIITINSIMYGNVNATSEQMRILDYNNDNVINILDRAKIKQVVSGEIESEKTINGNVYINSNNPKNCIEITDDGGSTQVSIGLDGVNTQTLAVQQIFCSQVEGADATNPLILLDGQNGVIKLAYQSGAMSLAGEYVYIDYESIEAPKIQSTNSLAESTILEGPTLTCTNSANQTTTIDGGDITCVSLTQTSKAEEKKDFEKYQGALKELENIDIYKYRMKNEDGKKHIGFVIGDDFKYSKEVTNQNNDGVDVYSFVSLCCQAIKELQEEIKELRGKINE